ncbi:MAG: recombinase family protein [Clostridia bacterium]|nr:recombinase family protein [Clostridia bacterium]
MDLYNMRKEISSGKSIYDLPLKVTYYARVSSEKDEQLNSLSNQVFYFENHIKEVSNWTYVDGYVDEGISGTSVNKRDSFKRMIVDSKKGKFDLILTKEVTRFARNTLDSISYTQKLLENGVGVYFQSDNINTIMPDSELRLTIMASVAQDEVRKLSERVKFGFSRSVEKKRVLGNNNIFGYRKDKTKLVIHKEEAKMIRELFEIYSRGEMGFYKISEYFRQKGYTGKNGTPISSQTLRRIIRNPKYKGYYRTGTVKVVDYKLHKAQKMPKEEWQVFECKENIPAIVSEELWEKCNNILEKKSQSILNRVENKDVFKSRYAFSGLIFCKEHEGEEYMPGFNRISGSKRSNKPAWACSKYITHGLKQCESPIIQESELIDILKVVLNKFLSNKEEIVEDLLNKYKKYNFTKDFDSDISNTENDINVIQAKKDKLLELTIKNLLSDEEFYKRNEELNKEIQKQQEKIKDLKEEKENLSSIEDNMKQIKGALEKEIKIDENIEDLIKLLVDKIYVSKVNGDRKHIKLEIYFKIGEPVTLEGNLRRQEKQEYVIDNEKYLLCDSDNNEHSTKENDYQSLNHDIYNCSREY